MGMLEMGITFSFSQLILDSAIVAGIRDATARLTLPGAFNDAAALHDLVAMYKGDIPAPPRQIDRRFWQGASNRGELDAAANALAEEILHTHKVEPLDSASRRQLHRIVLSAEL